MTAHPAHYEPRHADPDAESAREASDAGDAAPDAVSGADSGAAGAAAREHALALLAASPVYPRVARLLGPDGGAPFAAGRSDIAARLAQLPPGWHVVEASGLDHLVVGPGGVFAVGVQHHPDAAVAIDGDTFTVNGRQQRCITKVRRRTARLAKSLSGAVGRPVTVHPVAAVSGAQRGFAIKRQPQGVTVVSRKTVTPFLHEQPAVLDTATVERIATAAGRLAGAR